MSEKRKRRLTEWGKSLLIVLLSVSALYLVGRTQFYMDGSAIGQSWLASVLSILPGGEETQPAQSVAVWSEGTAVRPVRAVVTSPHGRSGIQYDQESVERLFSSFANPLSDALAGCSAPEQTTAAKFQAALGSKNPGVYLDFLGGVPLADLSAWLSGGRAPNQALTDTARRLLLTVTDEGDVVLYYINEDTGLYYACETTRDLAERLSQLVEGISPNGAAFAFESGGPYAILDPYTLLEGGATPQPGRYASSNPVPLPADTGGSYGAAFDALVQSLSFHAQSMSYPYRNAVAVQEGAERLHIFKNGLVTYEAADLEDPRFPVQGEGENLTHWEIVGSAWAFVERTLSPLCGEARLYLIGTEEGEAGGTAVLIGYQLDGAPVLVGRDGYAARVEISGGAITAFRLQLRTYTYLEEGPMVLPELQATAALSALEGGGSELMLYYPDTRGDTVTAAWGAF